jgi:hypothetical protein
MKFFVIFADGDEIKLEVQQAETAVAAILQHSWITTVYKESWVAAVLASNEPETTIELVFEKLGWRVSCLTWESVIMSGLNGGDSSSSSSPQDSSSNNSASQE